MEPRVYHIRTLPPGTQQQDIDWAQIPVASIDTYRWLDGGYAPVAQAQLVWIPEDGFHLRMTCMESNPKALYEAYNQPVYTDSCLEFFAAYVDHDPQYMNMEMNARGTLLSCIGPDRHHRTPILDRTGGALPSVVGRITEADWSVTAHIPASLLARVYGMDCFAPSAGYTFRGNFYKCGDETPIPHYGMWNPVGTVQPDFHCPEFFGTLMIV